MSVGSSAAPLSPLERRLLEFGFVHGEQVEILAEARPGRDPFVVRVGHTTLAMRRREAQSVWVELHRSEAGVLPQAQVEASADRVEVEPSADRVELHHSGSSSPPQARVEAPPEEKVELGL